MTSSTGDRRVLIVDGDPQFGERLKAELQERNMAPLYVNCPRVAEQSLDVLDPNVAVINRWVGEQCGIELLTRMKAARPELYVILALEKPNFDDAIAAFRTGAGDCISKPFDGKDLQEYLQLGEQRIEAAGKLRRLERDLLEKSRVVQNLEEKAGNIERELAQVREELAANAHKAGLAEVSTSVLHNVGNILTSVITSCNIVKSRISSDSKQDALSRGVQRLTSLLAELPDQGGQDLSKLTEFFTRFEKLLQKEQEEIRHQTDRMESKLELIKSAIRSQQSYASAGFQSEDVFLHELVEDTLNIHESTLKNRGVRVDKHYFPVPKVYVQKAKLLHILVNLFKNAWESMDDERHISVIIKKGEKWAYIHISDSGCGIPQENLKKIFEHGFTTKEEGHGFGLHSCASAMTEMGGAIWAESDGPGKGSTFTLRFPLPLQ